jgi:hypothetical protein
MTIADTRKILLLNRILQPGCFGDIADENLKRWSRSALSLDLYY